MLGLNPIMLMLAIAFTEKAFKNFNTFDEICDLAPPWNHEPRILKWANPMGALPSVSIDLLNVLKHQSPSSISSSTSSTEDNQLICEDGWSCAGCNLRPDKQPEPKCVREHEEEFCSTSIPTTLSEKAASSDLPGSGRQLCYGVSILSD